MIDRVFQGYKALLGYRRLLKGHNLDCVDTSLELGAGKAYISRLLRKKGIYTYAIDNEVKFPEAVDDYISGDLFDNYIDTDLVVSCGLIEHFSLLEIAVLVETVNKMTDRFIMWYPSMDWKWRLLLKIRRIKLKHYQHSYEDLKELFKRYYKVEFKTTSFLGLHYNCIYGRK